MDDSVILNNHPTDVDESGNPGLPKTFQLAQNHPNPFNSTRTIEYALPHRSNAVMVVYPRKKGMLPRQGNQVDG